MRETGSSTCPFATSLALPCCALSLCADGAKGTWNTVGEVIINPII